jgi:AcrR family transcriptional regulator
MDACLELIETEGIGAVSLRRVARAAGVSPGAPYHHFADRAALLAALSGRGFELLATDMATARSTADTPRGALTALTEAYVDFARRRPAYFRLMFRPELSQSHKNPEAHVAGEAAFSLVGDVIAECVDSGVVGIGDADVFTITLWALGHGLASLWVDGQLGERAAALDSTAEALIEQTLRLVDSLLTP